MRIVRLNQNDCTGQHTVRLKINEMCAFNEALERCKEENNRASSKVVKLKTQIMELFNKNLILKPHNLETFKLKQSVEDMTKKYEEKKLQIEELKHLLEKSKRFSEKNIREKDAKIVELKISIANFVKKVEILY